MIYSLQNSRLFLLQLIAKIDKIKLEKVVKTKFENAIIIKDFDSSPFVGDLIVCDDKIVYVGGKTNIAVENTIDCKNKIVMPGFINANTTSYR